MKWVGLTGGIATGKSTVAQMLRYRQIEVVDADHVAHAVMAQGTPCFQEIVRTFGEGILNAKGEIDRTHLGSRVFGNLDQKKKLESIVHPEVRKRAQQERARLQAAGHALAFYDVPLLFEKNLTQEFNSVVLVYSPVDLQRQRLKLRNQHLSERDIEMRIASQIDIEAKISLSDYVIRNLAGLDELERQVEKMLKHYQAHE